MSTAYSLVTLGLRRDRIVNVKRGEARKLKVTPEVKDVLVSIIVEAHPDFTLNQINHDLRRRVPDAPQ